MNDTKMNSTSAANFMKALANNKNLWEIRYLHLRHAPMPVEGLEYFNMFLNNLEKHNKRILRYLDLGSLSKGVGFLFNK